MRILIVRLSALGDIVHALPLAKNARSAGADVGWLAERAYAGLLDRAPFLDRLFLADTKQWRREPFSSSSLRERQNLKQALRSFAPDVTMDAQGLWKSAWLARWAGAPVVGFAGSERKERVSAVLCDREVRPAGKLRHIVEKNLSLLEALGIPIAERAPDARFLLAHATAEASSFLSRLSRPFALYHPGAGRAEKTWGESKFADVAARLRESRGLLPVVSWGPGDEARVERLSRLLPGAVAAPHLDFPGLAHVIAASALFVAGDTGPLHLADALGARILALYGPTDPARNGPYRSPDSAVRYSASTSPEEVTQRALELLPAQISA